MSYKNAWAPKVPIAGTNLGTTETKTLAKGRGGGEFKFAPQTKFGKTGCGGERQ